MGTTMGHVMKADNTWLGSHVSAKMKSSYFELDGQFCVRPLILLPLLTSVCFGMLSNHWTPPGAILRQAGRVSSIKDTITVQLTLNLGDLLSQLDHILSRLGDFALGVERMQSEIRSPPAKSPLAPGMEAVGKAWYNLCRERIDRLRLEVQDIKVDLHFAEKQSLSSHAVFREKRSTSPRPKRGLFNFVGIIAKSLFGVATEDDVKSINEKLSHAEKDMRTMGKVVRNSYANQDILLKRVNTLSLLINDNNANVNKFQKSFDLVSSLALLADTLSEFDVAVNAIRHSKDTILADILDAATNRVTSRLLPIYHLRTIISEGMSQMDKNPIFPVSQAEYYYPLLETTLTWDSIYIHIPLQSEVTFDLWNLHPFPFFLNGSLLTLDLPDEDVLLSDDRSWLVPLELGTLRSCKGSIDNLYVCPAYLYSHSPLEENPCLSGLLLKNSSSDCPLKRLNPNMTHHVHVPPLNSIFFLQKSAITVNCPCSSPQQQQQHWTEVMGPVHIPDNCGIRAKVIKIDGSAHHLTHHLKTSELFGLVRLNLSVPVQALEKDLAVAKKLKQLKLKHLDQSLLVSEHISSKDWVHVLNASGALAVLGVITLMGCVLVRYRAIFRKAAHSGQSGEP